MTALSTAIRDWLASSIYLKGFSRIIPFCIDAICNIVMEILAVLSEIAVQLMTEGAMLTVLSSLITALAFPAAMLSATDLIDTQWAVAVDRCVLIIPREWLMYNLFNQVFSRSYLNDFVVNSVKFCYDGIFFGSWSLLILPNIL